MASPDSVPSTTAQPLDADLASLAALAEPVRRDLYRYVAPRPQPVGRDEAARAVGISRALAAFHLDQLVTAGLLETEYRRTNGRTGPGAGRPSKLYRRAKRDLRVSLPNRQYELAARLFATALETPAEATESPRTRLGREAEAFGEQVGEEARQSLAPRAGRAGRRDALEHTLMELGYEPRRDEDGTLRLGNCPFHDLAAAHRDLTCGMNLALTEGVLEGVRGTGLHAELDPQAGYCCVAFREGSEFAESATDAERDGATEATPIP
jgi:predicted ArsR family transcriptional regulator